MSVKTGRLISIEGGEGAGKSTVMSSIAAALVSRNVEVVTTREPGGTVSGESIRALLLDPSQKLFPETELLLMFAARAQLVREVITPALARGAFVLTDRFTDASFAYQGGGRGIDSGRIADLERWAAGIKTDITFLLDVGVAQGLARARSRGGELDRIECEQDEFFERVRAVYLARARAEPARIRVINASAAPDAVAAETMGVLNLWLDSL